MVEHTIDPARIHHDWDRSLEPSLRVEPGDVVHFDLLMAAHGQVEPGMSFEDARFDFDTLYNLLGPVFVEGAEPGDALRVEILELTPGDWGWCAVLPELGLLPEDFPDPFLRFFDLSGGRETAELAEGKVQIPVAPFLGTMGTLPDDVDKQAPFPPHKGGGNIDTRHLVAGTTLWLPVFCPGALFSCGDPHAAQGDGEVCVAALETSMRATLRFDVEKRSIPVPQFEVPGGLTPLTDAGGYHATMGICPDLMDGAKTAVRAMVDWMADEHGLERADAYVTCSLAGDLKIFEIVDAGMWNVGFTMPHAVFR